MTATDTRAASPADADDLATFGYQQKLHRSIGCGEVTGLDVAPGVEVPA